MTVSIRYITLYVGGVPVQVVEGGSLHLIFAGLGATTVPGVPAPGARPDPFPQYVHDDEVANLVGAAQDSAVAALVGDDASQTGVALRAAFDAWGGGTGGGSGVDATDVGYDVVLLMGQSNMAGAPGQTFETVRANPSDTRVWTFDFGGTFADQITRAVDPLHHQGGADGVGPGVSFGRWFAARRPGNRHALLVPVAFGGTSLTATTGMTWNPAITGSLYDATVTQAQAALAAAGPNARFAAVLWHQGESDSDSGGRNNPTLYRDTLDALIANLRADLSSPALPFIIGGLVPEYIDNGTTNQALAAVHADTPNRVAYTGYAAGPVGMHVGDQLHYTPAGARELGRRMAAAYIDALANTSPASTPALSSTVAPAITGTAITGQTLTVSNGSWSATPDSFTRQWKRAGAAIAGATTSTYALVQADEGQAITCTVTAIKAGYTAGTATSNSVTPVAAGSPALTNTTAPSITGTPTQDQTLTATNGTWSATPDSFAYQWKRAGANIAGATAGTYVLSAADVGSTITVAVTATKAGYTSATATSSATATVAAPSGSTEDVGPALTTLRGTPTYNAGKFGNAMSGGVLAHTDEIDAAVGTIEYWMRATATDLRVAIGAEGGWWVGINGGLVVANIGGDTPQNTGVNVADGAWHHIAFTIEGAAGHRTWVDGQVRSTRPVTKALAWSTAGTTTAVGGFGLNTQYDWSGDIDEVRFSSVIRYTAAFTPPTTPFTADGDTLALYHLNG